MADKLKEQFPEQEKEDEIQDVLGKMASLKQGGKSLKDYTEEAKGLVYLLSSKWEKLSAMRFAEGLADKGTRRMVKGYLQARKENCSGVSVREITRHAAVCGENEGEEEQRWMGKKDKDELWTEAFQNQNKVLEGITSKLSKLEVGENGQGRGNQPLGMSNNRQPGAYGQQSQGRGLGGTTQTCYRCVQQGHIAPYCRNKPLPVEEQAKVRQR